MTDKKITLTIPNVITESIKTYPRGRGKVLIIAEKRVEKRKKKKENPSYLWKSLKSNPSNINFVEYMNNDNIKRFYIFCGSENRQLSFEERWDLAVCFFSSLMQESQQKRKFLGNSMCFSHISNTMDRIKKSGLIPKKFRTDILKKLGEHQKWLSKVKTY